VRHDPEASRLARRARACSALKHVLCPKGWGRWQVGSPIHQHQLSTQYFFSPKLPSLRSLLRPHPLPAITMAWRRSSQPPQHPRTPPAQNRERNPSVRGGGDAPRPTDKVTRPPPGRRDSQPQVKSPGQANQATQARQEMESHRSVNGFNADLVKEDMRKGRPRCYWQCM